MSFGQLIREIWQSASDNAKQRVNQISHGQNEAGIEMPQRDPAKAKKTQVDQGFEHIQKHFSDCLIDKPILNEPLPESGDSGNQQ